MATVASLIRGALRTLGVLASGETPTAAEEADGLVALNDMLDSWAGERLTLFATLRSTHTLTPSLSPHTIGDGGTFDTTRPVRIERASVIPASSSSTETPLDLLTDAEWQALQSKTSSGTPSALWVDSQHPLSKLYLWPIPSAADTLVLYSWQQLGRFAATSTTVDLPPGYARALRYNLALELCAEYGKAAPAEVLGIAVEAKAALKRLNIRPALLFCDAAILPRGAGGNIVTGGAV